MAADGIRCGFAMLVAWLLFLQGPAEAASSAWFDAEGGRLRVVTGERTDDGSLLAFLDIDLSQGWKTYWREPGESGIPPRISLHDASGGPLEATLRFPPPERIDDGYSVWAGYKHPVRLPILVKEAPDGLIEGRVFLGICENICIPMEAAFTVDTSEGATPLERGMIEQAFNALPTAPDREFGVEQISLSDDGHSLLITVRVPHGTEETVELFAAPPDGWNLATPTKEQHDDGGITFAVAVKDRPTDAVRESAAIDIVLTTLSRSVRQSITLP